MLEYPGCGVEYGTEWIIREILREHLSPANTLEAFEQSVADCYPETVKIGWIEYDTVSALKELDPVSWDLAHSEFVDNEFSDGNLVTFDDGACYYWSHEVEKLISEQ
jgi:phage terminase large subunit-like protein